MGIAMVGSGGRAKQPTENDAAKKAAAKHAKKNGRKNMGIINTTENSKKYEGVATAGGIFLFACIITGVIRMAFLEDSQRVPTVFVVVCLVMCLPLLAQKLKPWAEKIKAAEKRRE